MNLSTCRPLFLNAILNIGRNNIRFKKIINYYISYIL
jgi:hypothetical protein